MGVAPQPKPLDFEGWGVEDVYSSSAAKQEGERYDSIQHMNMSVHNYKAWW